MATRVLVRKLREDLWQWRATTAEGAWLSDEFYTGDINLLKEAIAGAIVWLIVPGTSAVSQVTEADIKDRKQLTRTLPFELEDDIIDPVEQLHFAFGPIQNDSIAVVYAETDYLRECIDELEALGAEVQRCLVDYLQMTIANGAWTVLLEGDLVWAHTAYGEGFTVEAATAPLYFRALAEALPPSSVLLVADHDQALEQLASSLPNAFQSNGIAVERKLGCYWDLIDPRAQPVLDFRTGALAQRLPLEKWWKTWQMPLIAYAAAFLVTLGATMMAKVQTEKEQRQTLVQTDEIYRQVVPAGSITNPERQLKAMLGGTGAGVGKPSNAVTLIAAVAPAIDSFDDVVIRNFRYNADSAQLQMNIEASSFGTFENLRSKIAEQGYQVEIKSANVYGEVHQAQLRVTEAG